MVFSSPIFLFIFLPLVLIGYFLIKDSYKNFFLMIISLLFYMWGEPRFVIIMILSILLNYSLTIAAVWSKEHMGNRIGNFIFSFTIIANLGILFYFKYWNFFIGSLNIAAKTNIPLKEISLPIGISFFTFQGISYVIDAYTEKVPVQKNILNIALYISMFPQLVAGPIVRYIDINGQIDRRYVTIDSYAEGIRRFTMGLAKKAIIANQMAFVADSIFNLPAESHYMAVAWVGVICYALQIYFDFSGYSDMAIGLGKLFGFIFLENFNYPYISKNITEFWRRWHISLSSWFRDYLYIPLGGNRRGNIYLHLWIVFLTTGLWHGASWNFIIWGAWHGLFIFLERLAKNKGIKLRIPLILKWLYTMCIVLIGWVFFRSDNLEYAIKYLGIMFGLVSPQNVGFTLMWYLNKKVILIILIAILASIPYRTMLHKFNKKSSPCLKIAVKNILTIFLLILSIMFVMTSTYNPFIYFRF